MTARSWIRGDWFISYTGLELDPLHPRPEDIDIRDIAHALAMIPRYGGHCPVFYSVASHSLYVSTLVAPDLAREGLMHDAAEAYVGDMITSIKRHLPDYKTQLEAPWERAINERFGLRSDDATRAAVKRADIAALLAERRDLFGENTARYVGADGAPGEARCWAQDPVAGEREFLSRARELGLV